MADGALKAEKDFSKDADKLIPEATQLAESEKAWSYPFTSLPFGISLSMKS